MNTTVFPVWKINVEGSKELVELCSSTAHAKRVAKMLNDSNKLPDIWYVFGPQTLVP